MRRIPVVLVSMLVLILFSSVTGCSPQQTTETPKQKITEQDVRNAVTELINGINSGNVEVVKKYVGAAGPVAEKLVDKLKNNVKIHNIRDITIRGTNAQATVTLEIVPLNINKDVKLNFDVTDVLLLNNPLGLLAILL